MGANRVPSAARVRGAFALDLRSIGGQSPVLSLLVCSRYRIAFEGPIAMPKRHTTDSLAVDGRILIADPAVDFLAVRKEVDVGRPSRDIVLEGKISAPIRVDFDWNQAVVHLSDEGWILESFFVEQLAGWTMVAVEMQKQNAIGRRRALDSRFVVLGPGDVPFRGR